MAKTYSVAGIGELLWDVFPHRERIGGAPANFAWHCSQIGAEAYTVSSVGNDEAGQRMRAELRERGVDTRYVQVSEVFATGQALVKMDSSGKADYEIVADVAWDHLSLTADLKWLAERLDAVCFGTLAQRSQTTQQTIQQFLQMIPSSALKIFDVNLRQNYFSKELINDSLTLANALKLSDEELEVISRFFALRGTVTEQLQQLRTHFDLSVVVYTRGANGSLLVTADEVDDAPGLPSNAIDSVGAGDSFTAAICMGLLADWPLRRVNEFANQVASFVCTQSGATPELPKQFSLNTQPTVLSQ